MPNDRRKRGPEDENDPNSDNRLDNFDNRDELNSYGTADMEIDEQDDDDEDGIEERSVHESEPDQVLGYQLPPPLSDSDEDNLDDIPILAASDDEASQSLFAHSM